jgi:hypothetical protein
MAFVLTNARLFAGGVDLTAASNKIELACEVDDVDTTTFASSGFKECVGGLASSKVNGTGYWEAGDPTKVDDGTWAAMGASQPWCVCPADATVGAVAYFTSALNTSYTVGGEVGDAAPWEAKGASTWPVVRGQVAHPPGTPRTATGTGTGVQLGAVATGKSLYAVANVLSLSGTGTPTITLAIESDDNSGFTSPTTVATFVAATVAGGQILRAPGPFTDTWYRAKWTISGTSPSMLFVVALGVQ